MTYLNNQTTGFVSDSAYHVISRDDVIVWWTYSNTEGLTDLNSNPSNVIEYNAIPTYRDYGEDVPFDLNDLTGGRYTVKNDNLGIFFDGVDDSINSENLPDISTRTHTWLFSFTFGDNPTDERSTFQQYGSKNGVTFFVGNSSFETGNEIRADYRDNNIRVGTQTTHSNGEHVVCAFGYNSSNNEIFCFFNGGIQDSDDHGGDLSSTANTGIKQADGQQGYTEMTMHDCIFFDKLLTDEEFRKYEDLLKR